PTLRALGVPRVDVHRDVEAGPSGPDHDRLELDQLAHPYRSEEVQRTEVHGDAVGPGPTGRTGVPGLVDPLHHGPAMHLAAEVDVGRLREKPERDAALPG